MVAGVTRLVAILGPTASGKSELAMKLAREFGGEIICADSRTIYRGMDIGTAKPSAADQKEIPHHMLDLASPDNTYSAAEFKAAALRAINEIRERKHLPILVGGSGLYAYAVLYDYQFPAGTRSSKRAELEQRPLEDLVHELKERDPGAVGRIDLKNSRRVIRALETIGQPHQRQALDPNVILVGLRPSDSELQIRIDTRTKQMMADGLVDEVRRLLKRYPDDLEAFKSPGYAEVVSHLTGEFSLAQTEDLIALHSRQLAKRQLTWLRRNQDIDWFQYKDQAYRFIASKLKSDRL